MFPLKSAKSGELITIQTLACSAIEASKLRDLGCVEGAQAKVVKNHSNIILQLGESRVAITSDIASSILVLQN